MAYEPKIRAMESSDLRNATVACEKPEPALQRVRVILGANLDRLQMMLERLDTIDDRLSAVVAGPLPKNAMGDKRPERNGADMPLAEIAERGAKMIEELSHLADRLSQHAG